MALDAAGRGMSGSSDFAAFLEKGQQALESLFPAVLVWDGVEYLCAGSGARVESSREPGGFVKSGDRSVRVSKELMPAAPALGDVVALDGEDLRVSAVSLREWDVAWSIQLEPKRV